MLEEFLGKVTCIDCLEAMKQLPDKCIDLVLTDPPYGLNYDKVASKQGGKIYGNAAAKKKEYLDTNWDNNIPEKEYFDELIRISKNQIIFGGEHICLNLPKSRGWIVWNKNTGDNNFSDCELAWTNLDKPIKKYDYTWNGMIQQDMKNKEQRYHPTQKPVGLFTKIITDYSKEGDIVLDAFSGSGTTGVACIKTKRQFIGFELEQKYVDIANKRIQDESRKLTLF